MRELYRRGVVGALALLLDAALQAVRERWSPTALAIAGLALAKVPRRLPLGMGLWGEAALLATALGHHRLRTAASALQQRLAQGDAAGARQAAAALLQRDPGAITADELAAAGILGLADATADQVVAPLCYYLLLGLPGALLYRLALQMQASFGPQGAPLLRWLRWLPARASAALFVAAARLCRENSTRAWRIWRRDGCEPTAAPELAPRSALAGALGIELEDASLGAVGAGERRPQPADLARALRLARAGVALAAGLMLGLPLLARLRK